MIDIYKVIEKEFGKVIKTGADFVDFEPEIISVSPAIDLILGGGIPEGSFIVLTGAPKSGKSSLALSFAGNAQQLGKKVVYINVEGRIKSRDIKGIYNLDPKKIDIVQSTQQRILYAEDYLRIAEQYLENNTHLILIIDSFSLLCTKSEGSSDIDKLQRADVAKLLSKFCRRVAGILPVNQNILIGITHVMGNVSGYGAPTIEKSGYAIAYQADIKLRVKTFKYWTLSDNDKPIGQIVNWECITSALGPPGQKIDSYLRYGHGLDRQMEVATLAIDFGIVKKSSSWFSVELLGEEIKKQGLDNFRDALVQNPKQFEALKQKVYELLQ